MAIFMERACCVRREQLCALDTDRSAGESGGIFSAGAATNRKRRSSALAADGTRRENYADEVRPALETCSRSQRVAGLRKRRIVSDSGANSPGANKSG